MKKILCISLCVCVCITAFLIGTAETQEFTKTSAEFVNGIRVGWNLGNTLESCKSWGDMPDNPTPEQQETAWKNPVTTKAMIDKVASTGFNAVRIPITWAYQVTESNGVYTIKEEWLDRIQTVVDYCVANDMYIIINMHHDDQYSVDGGWINISAEKNEFEKILDKYSQLWKQIANHFKNYNEKLIFEGLNEVCANVEFDGCGSGTDKCWWGHSDVTFQRLNRLYQKFIDTVRATGGNNAKRYLMIPTYGAQWYENQIKNITPTDSVKHLIVDIHWYDTTTQTDYSSVEEIYVKMWKRYADQNGYGIVLGETGFQTSGTATQKKSWANNFVKPLKEDYGIPVFLWDDGGDFQILYRSKGNWTSKGKTYVNIVVSAINSIYETESSATTTVKSTTTKPVTTVKSATPKLKLVSGKKRFKVKYTKVKNAAGFQIRYKIKGKWTVKTFNTQKSVTKTIKKLKSGKKYKVQIRSFTKGKAYYSNWSKVKTVKVK